MITDYRALVLLTAVLLAACSDTSQPTSPSESSLAPEKTPAANGIIITLLPGLSANTSSAQAVNDHGQIAGYSTTSGGAVHAVVWNSGLIVDLGPGQATDINTSGEVVGFNASRALLWTPTAGGGYSQAQDLGTLGGSSSDAQAINDGGQVTGASTIANGSAHAYLRSNGEMSDIHTISSGESFPWGLNNLGHVVGQWNGTPNQSFLWTPENGMQILPTLGGSRGVALDINDDGQVVGWSEPALDQADEAFIYENAAIRRLGTLGGAGSVAIAINASGMAVGRASIGGRRGVEHAFYWTATAGMKDIGLPKGTSSAVAWDVNSAGLIVGETARSSGKTRATTWRLPAP
ncbi:MAG: hypothetical protein ABI703_08875 [Gemmatimonadales bacterium]